MPNGFVIDRLAATVGRFRLRGISLSADAGEVLVILGPNGAGKSVALETIAGFHRETAGTISIRGREVTGLPPERRNVGLLFQNFGLLPHLSVAENVAFGQRARRRQASANTGGSAGELLARFGIADLHARFPSALSPGEKQRVALARALASRPDIFLFDEPFSALDARTREVLRDELGGFLRKMAIPAIFVTHDHDEALALGDQIAIMRDGAIVQSARATDVFNNPKDDWTATFLGIENVLPARIVAVGGDGVTLRVGDALLVASATAAGYRAGEEVALCVRAEDVELLLTPRTAPHIASVNRLTARILGHSRRGALAQLRLDCGFPLQASVMARELRDRSANFDDKTEVAIASDALRVVPIANKIAPAARQPRRDGTLLNGPGWPL